VIAPEVDAVVISARPLPWFTRPLIVAPALEGEATPDGAVGESDADAPQATLANAVANAISRNPRRGVVLRMDISSYTAGRKAAANVALGQTLFRSSVRRTAARGISLNPSKLSDVE